MTTDGRGLSAPSARANERSASIAVCVRSLARSASVSASFGLRIFFASSKHFFARSLK
jgi:hypothetical protein